MLTPQYSVTRATGARRFQRVGIPGGLGGRQNQIVMCACAPGGVSVLRRLRVDLDLEVAQFSAQQVNHGHANAGHAGAGNRAPAQGFGTD